MSEPIIEINNISKIYNIDHNAERYISLRDALANLIKNPFSAIKRNSTEEFWALKDINFSINRGEGIGIIGANGAGKSTLLKILSEITPPTNGEIILRGKVASLLEVGTGFHPELTGRENILLNGAILGMTKKEIKKKYNDIVEFAGVKKFIDTPVKRYSSGMYVRLAFSVAAHMEPDILVVDEVLAVGDAEFQKKCLGKMNEVMKKSGRTIIFVSHNMSAIEQLCTKCILLTKGSVTMIDSPKNVINHYQKNIINYLDNPSTTFNGYRPSNNTLKLIGFLATPKINNEEYILVKIKFKILKDTNSLSFSIGCRSVSGIPLFTIRDTDSIKTNKKYKEKQNYEAIFKINHNLMPGFYNIILGITDADETIYFNDQQSLIEIPQNESVENILQHSGIIHCDSECIIN